MVDESSGLLTVMSGVAEWHLDELSRGLELGFDPLTIHIDGGEDLLGAEGFLQAPVSEESDGTVLARGVIGILDLGGDDAVHGVAVVAGVDACRDVQHVAEFNDFGDRCTRNGLAGRGCDEERRTRNPRVDLGGDLDRGAGNGVVASGS